MIMRTQHLNSLLHGLVLSLFVGLSAKVPADDTEIFFLGSQQLINGGGAPNILLALDTSGSMNIRIGSDANAPTRFAAMKQATSDLIEGLRNSGSRVNLGLMRFTDPGGPILYPVADLNAPALDVDTEVITATPTEGRDDAEELEDSNVVTTVNNSIFTGNTSLAGRVLALGNTFKATRQVSTRRADGLSVGPDPDEVDQEERRSDGGIELNGLQWDISNAQVNGVRFFGLNSAGLSAADEDYISAVTIDFTARTNGSGSSGSVVFTGQAAANPAIFGNAPAGSVSSRPDTTASAVWSPVPQFSAGSVYTSPDLVNIFNEQRDTWGFTGNNGLVYFAQTGSGTSDGFQRAPHRHRNASNSQRMTLKLSVGDPTAVGIRFRNVGVPQGARIVKASVVFTAAPHPHSNPVRDLSHPVAPLINPIAQTSPVTIKIFGEKSEKPCFFASTGSTQPLTADGCVPTPSGAVGRVTLRPRTASSVSWTPEAWVPDLTYATADLSAVVQELVDNTDFCGGEDLALLFLQENGAGQRLAYSAEDGGRAPLLRVEYEPGAITPGRDACLEQTTARAVASDADLRAVRVPPGGLTNASAAGFVFQRSTYEFAAVRFTNLSIPRGSDVTGAAVTFNVRPTPGQNTGTFTVRVRGELSANSDFSSVSAADLRSRARTTVSRNVSFTLGAGVTVFEIGGLDGIIEEIIAQNGWAPGNALTLFFETLTAPSQAVVQSRSSAPTLAPSLRVSISHGTTGAGRVLLNADAMLSAVNSMTNPNWTPLVGQALEAALYFRGEPVLHGRRLGHLDPGSTVLSHPDSWTGGTLLPAGCSIDGASGTRCNSIGGSPVYRSPIQNECSPNHFVLLTDGEANHNGTSTTNFLEDGVDHGLGNAINFVGGTCRATTQNSDPTAANAVFASRNVPIGELCGRDIAFRLSRPDPSDDASLALPPAKRRQVKSHTIAFNLENPAAVAYLDDVAKNGGTGAVRTASTALELLNVFQEIVADVADDPTSFAAAATSVNTFNRLRNRDDVYFSLFLPSRAPIWRGNIKRYRVVGNEIVGRDCASAIDDRGSFRPGAVSFWSAETDGNVLEKGGTVGRMVKIDSLGNINAAGTYSPDDRRVYTFLGNYAGLTPSSNPQLAGARLDLLPASFNDLSAPQKTLVAGAFAATETESAGLFDWLRGKDARTGTVKLRYPLGDPLHASPVIVSLGGSSAAPVEIVLAATNDGGIRWFRAGKSPGTSNQCTATADDTIGGVELGVFYPREHFAKQKTMRDVVEGERIYTLDATPQVWRVDIDGDGQIEGSNGDFVRLVFGERDGGDRYYAIDITPNFDLATTTQAADLEPGSFEPRILWKIDGSPNEPGASTEYTDLGLTWSEPVIRFMRFNNDPAGALRTVVIFGGGNDTRFDRQFIKLNDAQVMSEDPKGNIVYVADAHSGRLLTSIGGNNTDAKLKIPGMNYPIPASIATMNAFGSTVDRLYFGDLGGNLWRVDFRSDLSQGSTGGAVATVGRLAHVSKPQTAAEATEFLVSGDSGAHGVDTRKFYYPPAIVRQGSTSFSEQGRHTVLLLGTGSRANPRNIVTEDHFYAFRDLHEERLVSVGETTSTPGTGVAANYPRRQKGAQNAASTNPIGGDAGAEFASDLFDVTDNPFQAEIDGSVGATKASNEDITQFRRSLGWFIRLPKLETTDAVPDPKNPTGPLITGQASHIGEKVLNPATVGIGVVFFSAYTPEGPGSVPATSCRAGVGFTRVYALDMSTASAILPDFGNANASSGNTASVLTAADRSAPDTLTGNPGGSTLLNTDSLKLITGTKVNNLGNVVPERTFWFQRQ